MAMMPNLDRVALVAHQTTAKTYYTDMCGFDGVSNPCSGVIKVITDGAWVSPAADKWCEKAEYVEEPDEVVEENLVLSAHVYDV